MSKAETIGPRAFGIPVDARVNALVPMAHVADVEASAAFYELFGLSRRDSLRDPNGTLIWQWMGNDQAHLMLTRASGPIDAGQQAVLFYLYCPNVEVLRTHLLAHGLDDGGRFAGAGPEPGVRTRVVFTRTSPMYMPNGEIRVHDPDGYCVLIGAL
jgi:catechol 2,3-dioxygenase-like lactoylglutathione lyase family enzyme